MKTFFLATGIYWWLEILKFIFVVFVAFYIPGSFFVNLKTDKRFLVRLTLATITGLVFWGWQEFIFGYLSCRNLTYFYLLACFIIWFLKKKKDFFSSCKDWFYSFKIKKENSLIAFLVLLGLFVQILPSWYNGTSLEGGVFFGGGNAGDNLWHASLTNELTKRFPPEEPGLPGTLVENYHYWSNLIIGGLVRIFKFPLFPLQFQFFPVLISLFLGLTSVSLALITGLGKKFASWLLFFVYFGGDLIYFILIVLRRGPNFFILSSLEDGARFLNNPPRALSFIISIAGLGFFSLWCRKKNNTFGLISMLLLASTIGLKVYTGLFFMAGISILAFFAILKKEWIRVLLFFSFYIFSAIIYLPVNARSGGLIWTPFLIVNNFMVQPDLGLNRWELARIIFLRDNKKVHNLIFEISFTSLFLLGILGTKLLGLFQPPSSYRRLGMELSVLILVGIFSGLGLGLFFIQESGGANTFNFLVSAFLFLSLLSSLSMIYWHGKLFPKIFLCFAATIIILTIPRVCFETVKNIKNILNHEGILISQEELELFNKLNKLPLTSSKIIIDPDHYLASQSPYLSLFIERPFLITGNGILESHGINIEKEEKIQELVFKTKNEKILIQELLANQLEYIFLNGNHSLGATESAYFVSAVARNKKGTVLEVSKEKLIKRCLDLQDFSADFCLK